MAFNRGEVKIQSAPGSWAYNDKLSIQSRLIRWSYQVMMKQRNIQYEDIQRELGVSRARVQQMLESVGSSETNQMRLDAAISNISKAKHDAVCECDDPACLVYTVTTPDPRVRQAEMGAMNDWRERFNPVLEG